MSALFAECMHDGHDALGKEIATLAACAGSLLAPHHEAAQFALGVIVRRRHPWGEGVREQRVLVGQQVGAGSAHVSAGCDCRRGHA